MKTYLNGSKYLFSRAHMVNVKQSIIYTLMETEYLGAKKRLQNK